MAGKLTSIDIRRMRPADLEEVMALLARWNIAPMAPSAALPDPERSDLIVENTFVAIAQGRIVGVRSYIQHSPTVAEGASLAVDPAFHSQGIGEQLQIAGYRDMYARGIRVVRGETDRPETVRWLVARFGHRIVGTVPKRHAFGSPDVDQWTVLELDLDSLPELRKL